MNARRTFATALAAALVAGAFAFSAAPVATAAVPATSVRVVSAHLDALATDMGVVSDAASSLDFDATHDALYVVIEDARALQHDHRPHVIPRASWRHLMQGTRYMIQGSRIAIQGIEDRDPDTINSGTDLIERANAEIDDATTALRNR